MASGGGSENNKQSYSEPRNRSVYSRLLNIDEDGVSIGSAPASTQDRLNNWDFSNWQPSSNYEGAKQPKRANEEKESRNRKKIGKENIAGAGGESIPQGDGGKQHKTPSTFPRTKVTPVMPLSQRIALENLRQHMTFSDVDELSTDGPDLERNNQRYIPRRGRPVEMSLERNEMGGASNKNTEPSRDNRNTQRNFMDELEEKPDSTQIVGRLMQIRDYIKQATSMMERLQSSGDPGDQGRASQLEQVINRLQEQEHKYLELLLKLSQDEGYITKLQILVDHLRHQETQTRHAVELELTAKEEGLLMRQNSLSQQEEGNGMNSQLDSESEAATELDIGTDTSENDEPEENTAEKRPLIEDKLGDQQSDTEEFQMAGDSRTNSRFSEALTPELDSTLVSENAEGAAADLLAKRHLLESDLTRKNDELYALKEQHDLLRKMLDQQEQLRDLQTRQAALVLMQKEAEQRLEEDQVEQDCTNVDQSKQNNLNKESPNVKNSNLSKKNGPDLLFNVKKDNIEVGKSHIPFVVGPNGQKLIPEHAKGSVPIGNINQSYVHPDDHTKSFEHDVLNRSNASGYGNRDDFQKQREDPDKKSNLMKNEACSLNESNDAIVLETLEEQDSFEYVSSMEQIHEANQLCIIQDNLIDLDNNIEEIVLRSSNQVIMSSGQAPIILGGNSMPGAMVLGGSSGLSFPLQNNPSQVMIQNNSGSMKIEGDEDEETVETYKVFYVVEWCEEDGSDDEHKSDTSCRIMEVDDIEDDISEIGKPNNANIADIIDEDDTETSENENTSDDPSKLNNAAKNNGAPLLEIFENDRTVKKAKDSKVSPRSDVSEAGSSNVGQGSVSSEPDNVDILGSMDYDDGDDYVPQELQDLRQRLDYLKNLYEIKDQPDDERLGATGTDNTSALSAEKAQLQSKLSDLHQKKAQMDKLLNELQYAKGGETRIPMNNEVDLESTSSSRINESIAATAAANQTEEDPQGLFDLLESRNKLKKLQEVKDRLSQLKGLVQYYQSGQDFIHGGQPGAGMDMPPPLVQERPSRPERPPDINRSSRSRGAPSRKNQSSSLPQQQQKPPQQQQQKRKPVEGSDNSETASQESGSLGMWGEDPEIQEKVRRLNDAKEKLHRLQELVAVIQTSPEGAQNLPDDLAELAASLEEGGESPLSLPAAEASSRTPERGSMSLAYAMTNGSPEYNSTTDSDMQYDQQEAYYQSRMMEQKDELDSLMDERKKLLQLQQELQRLHDTLPQNQETSSNAGSVLQPPTINVDIRNNQPYMQPSPNNRELAGETTSGEQTSQGKAQEAIGVTFQEPLETVISNEELYGRMRQQRMLREELREKKKELEDMMRKDRPKKQYSRNQDNQSDNVSYSNRSEQLFGGSASVDQTMATWGGSTVDNLESIEEDGGNSGDGQEAEECDDGYPSDGIVQVEEEEEQDEVDNDSDDRDTYTIEEEPYVPKGRSQRQQPSPPGAEGTVRQSRSKRATGKGAPFQGQGAGEPYNYWAPDNNQVLNNVRSSGTKSRKKKDKEESALKEEMSSVKEQIASLKDAIINMNKNPSGSSSMGQNDPGSFNANLQYMTTMQQQQMFLSLSQFHNQLLNQQQEMGDRLGRLERSFSSSRDGLNMADIAEASRRPYNSYENSPRDAPQFRGGSLQNLPHYIDNYSKHHSAPFNFRPTFPDAFSYPRGNEDNNVQESPSSANNRTGNQQQLHNRNNNHIDALRLEAVLQREAERNPFRVTQFPEERTRNMDSSYIVADTMDEPDAVPIETIQAQDMYGSRDGSRHVPRLNLDDLVRSRSNRRSERSNQGARPKQPRTYGASNKEKVIGQKFPTPSRANAAAKLASQRVTIPGDYRPGLSSGISGTACETASISSAVSSVPGGEGRGAYPEGDMRGDEKNPDESGDYTLFEALRETIYSEVATLISQNESRPHYLIEIFRELQMLNSDYLRQRALYAVQELVTQYQTEEVVREDAKQRIKEETKQQQKTQETKKREQNSAPGRWVIDGATASELTPSVSAFTSEEDEIRARLYDQIPHISSRGVDPSPSRAYDYSEKAQNSSNVETPDSGHWELPFAKDSLGETVIHLDKALQRMREYERRLTNNPSSSQGASPVVVQREVGSGRGEQGAKASSRGREGSISSSAQDNGSDGSVSDVPDESSVASNTPQYPRIDTQQLDQQIKGIMTEIIPVLKEHMEDVCSQQLLQYIKRLVLSLTKQQGDQSHEFVRFFQKQLGSILQDSLSKFDGRKMRDCGEDLLVDLSEILFNELAFFRLMQDLDNPEAKARATAVRKDSQTSTDGGVITQEEVEKVPSEGASNHNDEESSGEESDTESSSSSNDDDDDDVENEGDNEDGSTVEKQDLEGNYDTDSVANDEEQEELGKARDDELAAEVAEDRDEEDEEDPMKTSLKIQLVPSETKPMNRIGSDEDDEGDDETANYEDISDTAVSHEYGGYDAFAQDDSDDNTDQPKPLLFNNNNSKDVTVNEEEQIKENIKAKHQDSDKEEDTTETTDNQPEQVEIQPEFNHHQAPESAEVVSNEVEDILSPSSVDVSLQSPESVNNTVIEVNGASPESIKENGFKSATDEPKVNGAVSEEEIEEDIQEEFEVSIDDLPAKLTGLTNEELHGKKPVPEVTNSAMGTQEVLDYVNETTANELAGDAVRVPDPSMGTQV